MIRSISNNNIKVKDFDFKKHCLIKQDLLDPLKDLLSNYSIEFNAFSYNSTSMYVIRNGIINIPFKIPKLVHELAHIVLIDNFNKLLIDDWGMSVANKNINPHIVRKWLIGMEARVWGVESFISGYNRDFNDSWIMYSNSNFKEIKRDKDFNKKLYSDPENVNLKIKAQDIYNRYKELMTNEIILNKLKERFDFIQNVIDNNNKFDSKKFKAIEPYN